MSNIKLIIVSILIALILTACSSKVINDPKVDKNPNNDNDPVSENTTFDLTLLDSEVGIKKYLIGEWTYDYYERGDVISKMIIDENLNVKISFTNTYSETPKGFYSGKVILNRIYASNDEAPDMLSIELEDENEPGGDFFFLHRSNYANKRVMSLFYAGNGNSIFDIEDPNGEYRETPDEIFFQKTTNEVSKEKVRINDDFYAVYWGRENNSLWLDDVWWQVNDEDLSREYPWRMGIYENDVYGSVLYKVDPQQVSEVLGDEMPIGEVYYIETNNKGEIIHLIDAHRKDWVESDPYEDGLLGEVISVLDQYQEFRSYIGMGMEVDFEGDPLIIDGNEYYELILGTSHEDYFVNEIFYAVDINARKVLVYDVLIDSWVPLKED